MMIFEKQEYQQQCVKNIISILQKVDILNHDYHNLTQAIQKEHYKNNNNSFELEPTKKPRLDVLMETGTGKTFVYLNTIFEIHKQFNKKKFIIVVPRTAIKLGIIQNIKLTKQYFFNQYKIHLEYIDYHSKSSLPTIKHDLINSDKFCVLITTNSAFNSEKNNINQPDETLFESGSVWQRIAKEKPIVIIDEPHLLKGKETKKGLDELKGSLFIRFGATYPEDKEHKLANVAYSLDSISAFNQFLVKRIRVNTVFNEEEIGTLKISKINTKEKNFDVVYDLNKVSYEKNIRLHEDIGSKTGLDTYNGRIATKITKETVFLSDQTLKFNESYELSDAEIEMMIRKTIEIHFDKEEDQFKQGIKTLSLFFIPKVKDFREDKENPEPRIKRIFERLYLEIWKKQKNGTQNSEYQRYLEDDYKSGELAVHEGYFSIDPNKAQKESGLKKDDVGINLILNNKEKLLSFDTQLRFIFSVWALQEGWDNPNVFNICKLYPTKKDISRRQQVGRGLRIAVNQQGKRLTYNHLEEKEEEFYNINTLDVIVSGKEKEFITKIQEEIQSASFSIVGDFISHALLKEKGLEEKEATQLLLLLEEKQIIRYDKNEEKYQILCSIEEFLERNKTEMMKELDVAEERYQEIQALFISNRNQVVDGNKKSKTIKIKVEHWEKFQKLWEVINKKSKIVYQNIQEDKIIEKVAKEFNEAKIDSIRPSIKTQTLNTQENRIENNEEESQGSVTYSIGEDWIKELAKEECLPLTFILKLFQKIDTKKIGCNPEKSKEILIRILKDKIHTLVIQEVKYQLSQTSIYPNRLQNDRGEMRTEIKESFELGRYITEENLKNNLYDKLCYDSKIEEDFQKTSNMDEIKIDGSQNKLKVFAKLPRISIPTPYKTYNPDFAYLIERPGQRTLFLIVETKGYESKRAIPQKENQKIEYAEKFFKELKNEYPEVEICYQVKTDEEELLNILSECLNQQK